MVTRFKKLGGFVPHPQQNLDKYLRKGVITSVDAKKGTCTLQWLDSPGIRDSVRLTQNSSGEYLIPDIGAVAIVGLDNYKQAHILRFEPVSISRRIRKKEEKNTEGIEGEYTLPDLQPGEKYWETQTGKQFIHLTNEGDFLFQTLLGGSFELQNAAGVFRTRTPGHHVIADGVEEYAGKAVRIQYKPELGGYVSSPVTTDLTNSKVYSEYSLKVTETAGEQVLDPTTRLARYRKPLVAITAGNVIDKQGNVLDKTGASETVKLYPEKGVAYQIVLDNGAAIFIDKEGCLSIQAKSLNINNGEVDTNDPDIALVGEKASTKGTRGQHIAREHDEVSIPISLNYMDTAHTTLSTKGSLNVNTLKTIAQAIVSPAGPCFLNPAVLVDSIDLVGEITAGANKIYAGDS